MNSFAAEGARRWSDNDKYFGPFTYSKDNPSHAPFAALLSSGSDDYPGAYFRLSGFGHTLILALPPWALMPYREKTYAKSWSEEDVKRLGRDWYWSVDEREYGFSLLDGHLSLRLGRQTMDSSTEQSWGCFLPWTQWRHVRRSFYDAKGGHAATLFDSEKFATWDARSEYEKLIIGMVPVVTFEFEDFDGERIRAKTKMEEREWKLGTGWFKWLSLFRKPRIRRALDIEFSSEVGRRKGSWKGGTLGHGIDMSPDELHESAFRRYCVERELTFLNIVP